MNLVNQIFKNSKASLFFDQNGNCIQTWVFNYSEIIDFSKEKIVLSFLTIIGSELLITRLDEDIVEISGKIEEIETKKINE